MTPVRQETGPAGDTGGKAAPRRGRRSGADLAKSTVAQVRLQADEVALLHEAMRELGLNTTSDALREGIRLLVREAREITAAEEIRDFYAGRQVPLPDGVVPATPEELAAADDELW